MDVIASAAFGLKIDSHNDPNNQFVTMGRKALTPSTFFIIGKYYNNKKNHHNVCVILHLFRWL